MGEQAEKIEQEEAEVIIDEESTLENDDDLELGDDETIVAEDNDDVEIVREGTQPQEKFTQQQVNDIVNKRVKRLNNKVTASNDTTSEASAELNLANERNKILQMALDQAKTGKKVEQAVVKQPDPNNFADGVHDTDYLKQYGEYTNAMIADQVAKQVAQATQNTATTTNQDQQSQALLSKQVKHYERADAIGAKDYETTEDEALKVLGNETANHIIDNFDDSHVILYFLGKNPKEAERIASLLKSKPIKGVAEVGRLSAELKIKPRNKPAADPDEEIQSDGNTKDGAIDRKLEKLRANASKTGNMKALMDFKRKHKL